MWITAAGSRMCITAAFFQFLHTGRICDDSDFLCAPFLCRSYCSFEFEFAFAHLPARLEAGLLFGGLGWTVTGDHQRSKRQWIRTMLASRAASSRKEQELVGSMWLSIIFFLWGAN
jgi:hypothetical protein